MRALMTKIEGCLLPSRFSSLFAGKKKTIRLDTGARFQQSLVVNNCPTLLGLIFLAATTINGEGQMSPSP